MVAERVSGGEGASRLLTKKAVWQAHVSVLLSRHTPTVECDLSYM